MDLDFLKALFRLASHETILALLNFMAIGTMAFWDLARFEVCHEWLFIQKILKSVIILLLESPLSQIPDRAASNIENLQ